MNTSVRNQAPKEIIMHTLNNVCESLIELKQRLYSESSLKNKFENNYRIGNYHFDFYAPSLKLGIQVDAYSYSYSDIYNVEKVKLLSIPHKDITVLKVSDYQILVDCDEIIRHINNIIKKRNNILAPQLA